jgi:hypothetical protein
VLAGEASVPGLRKRLEALPPRLRRVVPVAASTSEQESL